MGIVRLSSKPGKANGNATANRFAVLPVRLIADKDYIFSACGLPRGYLRAVQINLRCGCCGADLHFGQSAVSRYHLRNSCNGAAAIQCVNVFDLIHHKKNCIPKGRRPPADSITCRYLRTLLSTAIGLPAKTPVKLAS
jgi:hypothetical protein